jgi:hypothetical protein
MKKRALHKVSHYIHKDEKKVILHIYVGTRENGLKRALYLACIEDYKIDEQIAEIKFTTYKQLKRIVPILNDYMEQIGYRKPYFGIDKECYDYFKTTQGT